MSNDAAFAGFLLVPLFVGMAIGCLLVWWGTRK